MKRRKIQFSKLWLIGCAVFSCAVTVTSYILALLDKNPVSELSIAIIDHCWGTSGVSFLGYAIQNCVRSFTASKYGITKEDMNEEIEKAKEETAKSKEGTLLELEEVLAKIYEGRRQ